jgi:hypothetical protein
MNIATNSPSASVFKFEFSRYKAATIHLLLSAVIACAVSVVMLSTLYPAPFFQVMGGRDILLLLIGVDVVLGPLITLIVFDQKKKSLKFDLAIICLIQLAALAYGMYSIFAARPAYAVFVNDKFHLVAASDIDPDDLKDAGRPEFRSLPIAGPIFVAVKAYMKDQDFLQHAATEGKAIWALPKFYVPLQDQHVAISAIARPVSELQTKNAESKAEIERELYKFGKTNLEVKFLPLNARDGNLIVLLDAKDGRMLNTIQVIEH